MLVSLNTLLISVIWLTCLASAFSTLFVTEEEEGGRKMEAMETKSPKMGEGSAAERVEVLPFETKIFNNFDDIKNLTPLKLALIISSQHLLNTIQNLPLSATLPDYSLNILNNIVSEFNKTTQIIKLTAEYVNISSHYIKDSLNRFVRTNSNQEVIKNTMSNINKSFLNTISNHIISAVQELNNRTKERELMGSDIVVSSAYHIVAAFHEMTNQIISLADEQGKNIKIKSELVKTPHMKQADTIYKRNISDDASETSDQNKTHRSIKKDQALPNQEHKISHAAQRNLQEALTIENFDDLSPGSLPTVEISFTQDNNYLIADKKESNKIPKNLQVAFSSNESPLTFQNPKSKSAKNKILVETGTESFYNSGKYNLGHKDDTLTLENNQDLTVEVFPPSNLYDQKIKFLDNNNNKNMFWNQEYLKKYFNPKINVKQQNNPVQNTDSAYYLKVPENDNIHYYQHHINYPPKGSAKSTMMESNHISENNLKLYGDIKHAMTPHSTIPQLGASINEWIQNHKKEVKTKVQDLTLETFSPNTFLIKSRSDGSFNKSKLKGEKNMNNKSKNIPYKLQSVNKYKYPTFYFLNKQELTEDKELALSRISTVNSLNNAPQDSEPEFGTESKNNQRALKKPSKNLANVLRLLTGRNNQFENEYFQKSQHNQDSCNTQIEPVCGIDKNKNNFIIFLNDCKRQAHNKIYLTNYVLANMDTCVEFLVKNSAFNPTLYIDNIQR